MFLLSSSPHSQIDSVSRHITNLFTTHQPKACHGGSRGSSSRLFTVNAVLLCVACFCISHLLVTTKYVAYNASLMRTTSGHGKEDDSTITDWENVQYISGEFRKVRSSEEKRIHQQCAMLAAVYKVRSGICAGPIPTNTTCCYCFFPYTGEKIGLATRHSSWSCVVPRNSSLPSIASRMRRKLINVNESKIAWMTGKFAHGNRFKNETETYCRLVRDMNLFHPKDEFCYWDSPSYVLQNKKFARHLQYRTNPNDLSARGGGYWFHKAVILRHHMDNYSDGDVLVWTDVDRIDYFELGTFHTVMKSFADRNADLSIEVMVSTREETYTKADMLAAFNASKMMRLSSQVLANVIVLRNGPKMKQLVDAWMECLADWHMVSDEPSVLPNIPSFAEHRHDQSILGLLIKTYLSKQGDVGPPARPYQMHGQINTFKFRVDDDDDDPVCPFPSFYAAAYMANMNKTI